MIDGFGIFLLVMIFLWALVSVVLIVPIWKSLLMSWRASRRNRSQPPTNPSPPIHPVQGSQLGSGSGFAPTGSPPQPQRRWRGQKWPLSSKR